MEVSLKVTTPCVVFDPEKAPRFSLSSCRIGCIARDKSKGLKQSDRMGLVESFFWRLSKCEQRFGCFGVTLFLTWGVGHFVPFQSGPIFFLDAPTKS